MLSMVQLREGEGTQDTTLLGMPVGDRSVSYRKYVVKEITGLDPVKADISVAAYSTLDGGKYQAARVASRNIVMTVGYNPNWGAGDTIDKLRNELYGYFPPKREAHLVFVKNNDSKTATRAVGYVESLESVIFSKTTEVQISIICPMPYITSYYPENPTGRTGSDLDTTIFGSAPSGYLLQLPFNQSVSRIVIQSHLQSDIIVEHSFVSGDTLRLSTRAGNKYIHKVNSSGTSTNILGSLKGGSLSNYVDSRTTSFKVITNGGSPMTYTLGYTPSYVGI